MSRLHAIHNRPSGARLRWLFLASAILSIVSVIGRHTCMHTYITTAGPTGWNPLSMMAVTTVFCGLAGLSWTQQRTRRALLEALIVAAGFSIPVMINDALRRVPLWLVGLEFFAAFALFAVVRLISLVCVRTFLRKLVLGTAPVCRRCDCDLTGNVSGSCPACGAPCEGPGTALEPPRTPEQAELRGRRRLQVVLLSVMYALGLFTLWMVFDGFMSGSNLKHVGRDLIMIAIPIGLCAGWFVRARKAG